MGLVGLVLARLGAAVYLTDRPSMMVHARVNAAKNKLLAATPPAAAPAANGAAGKLSGPSSDKTHAAGAHAQSSSAAPAAGAVTVSGLDWEDATLLAAAVSAITSQGPVDMIVATDCIYPDPNGTVSSSKGFIAAVRALATPGHTRVLTSFEARSDNLRQALLSAAAEVDGGCDVLRLEPNVLPEEYRTHHIELYELVVR